MNITVNERKITTSKESLSYEEIVALTEEAPGKLYSVTYQWRGPEDICRSGAPTPGQTVKLAEGMKFTVAYTGNS